MIKTYALAALALMLIGIGWQSNSWYRDSKELAVKNAEERLIKAVESRESDIARSVETKLQELRANEKVIEHHRTEIIDRPIYRSICIDDDGLRLINSYANGEAGKLITEMPADITESERQNGEGLGATK